MSVDSLAGLEGRPSGVPLTDAADTTATTANAAPKEPRNYGLDVARIMAIAGVMIVHTFGTIAHDGSLMDTTRWWIAKPVHLLSLTAVPIFVIISGALNLSPSAHAKGPAHFYRRRFSRIIPAIIAWHLVYIVIVRSMMFGEHVTAKELLWNFVNGQFYTALYFLWAVAGLYVVAPLFGTFFAAGGPSRARIVAGVAMGWTVLAFMVPGVSRLVGEERTNYLGSLNMWWMFLGYFLVGWALRYVILGWRGIAVVSVISLAAYGESLWQDAADPGPWFSALNPVGYDGLTISIVAMCIFVVAVSIGARVTPGPRTAKILISLSEATFGAFLVHLFILEWLARWFPAVHEQTSLKVMAATWAVLMVSAFAVSLGIRQIPVLRRIV